MQKTLFFMKNTIISVPCRRPWTVSPVLVMKKQPDYYFLPESDIFQMYLPEDNQKNSKKFYFRLAIC